MHRMLPCPRDGYIVSGEVEIGQFPGSRRTGAVIVEEEKGRDPVVRRFHICRMLFNVLELTDEL